MKLSCFSLPKRKIQLVFAVSVRLNPAHLTDLLNIQPELIIAAAELPLDHVSFELHSRQLVVNELQPVPAQPILLSGLCLQVARFLLQF